MIKVLRYLPKSDMCVLSAAEDDDNYLVYKLSSGGERYELFDCHRGADVDAAGYADGEYISVPVRSTNAATHTFYARQEIKNIANSTGDPKAKRRDGRSVGSWLELMRYYGCVTDHCCADGYFYVDNGECITENGRAMFCHDGNHDVSAKLVGGHVVIGRFADNGPSKGSTVYMLCICKYHNSYNHNRRGHGLGYFMRVGATVTGLRLEGYLYPPRVNEMIAVNDAIAEAAASHS